MGVRRCLYLAALCGCLVFYMAYGEWFSWFALLIVLGLPWVSLLLSLPAMLDFQAEAAAPKSMNAGAEAEVWLMGQCAWPVPPFKGQLRLRRIPTAEQWRYKTGGRVPAEHSGGVTISPDRVWVYDYLGLIGFPVRRKMPKTVLVRPAAIKMEVPPDLQRYLARSWRPKPGGGYAENHELRLYRPGDSLNQVHWKLTAKTGKLILREPMQPNRGLMLLTMNLRGTPEELDRKFGRLQWLGNYLLEKGMSFQVRVLTGGGVQSFSIQTEPDLKNCVDSLLCCESVAQGDLREREYPASWRWHIGGGRNEI